MNPQLKNTRGAIVAQNIAPKNDKWIASLFYKIQNKEGTPQLPKGGNGIGLYYLRDFNRQDIGKGLFGYGNDFNGLGVIINTVL